jgi:transcriptional regulator with XRE-family HTH domain
VSIGDALAAARREAGLTITQVSQRTCIRETIVRGIERGDYSACGGDFYARGHIRSIARAVGLDPDALVREYDATQAAPQSITAADVFQPFTPVKLKERRRANWSILLLAGLVAVLGIAGFKLLGSHNNSPARTAGSTSVDHSHKQQPKPTATPVTHAKPRHVRLVLVAKPGSVTWAELTTSTGRVLYNGDVGPAPYPPRKIWTTKHWVTLSLGNPSGAVLYLNGVRQPINQINPVILTCTRTKCTVAGH